MVTKVKTFTKALKHIFGARVTGRFDGLSRDIVNSDRKAILFGYTLVAIVFGGFGLWAALAPLESAARGAGTVQVEGDTKPVQHLEGGIVAEILVSSGDYVREGQSLLRLDSTQLVAEKSIVEGRLWAKRAAVERLVSERDQLEQIAFSSSLLELSDKRALTAIENERALFAARKADRLGQIEVVSQRRSQLESQIIGLEAVISSKQSISDSLDSEVSDLKSLLSDGYVDKQRIRELERSLAQNLGELADLQARKSAALVELKEAELEILQIQNRFITEVVNDLGLAQEQLYDLAEQLRAINDRVTRSEILSPASGVVLALKPNTLGAVISPGSEIMSIVPDIDRLVIDTRLSPMDIDRLELGQEAEVRFSVFKDSYSITGVLTKLSADSLTDDETGSTYYEGKVALLEEDLTLLGNYKLIPGMPADVLIKTGNRTLLGYITSPLNRMFENAFIEE